MLTFNNTEYATYDTTLQGDAMLDLKKFKDSANFFLGMTNHTVDIMDNPYVQIAVYRMSMDYKLRNPVKLKKCEKKELLRMMSPLVASYYPNSVCLDEDNDI
jgi:hypothetical protein